MKKFFVVCLITVFGLSAWAEEGVDYDYSLEAIESEFSDLSETDNKAFQSTQDLGDIIRVIIAGAIAADRLDRDHRRRGYRGRVVCYAEDRRGRTFSEDGRRPRLVQERALNKCERRSNRRCRPLGCRTERWG